MSHVSRMSPQDHIKEAERLLELSRTIGDLPVAGVWATQALVHLRLVDIVAPRRLVETEIVCGPAVSGDWMGKTEASR